MGVVCEGNREGRTEGPRKRERERRDSVGPQTTQDSTGGVKQSY